MWPTLDDAAFRLGDESVTYGELLLLGASTGLLDPARSQASRAVRALAANPEATDGPDLRKEAESFRRERRLHSGDDLRAWLARRELDEKQWTDHLRRAIALRAELEESDAMVGEGDVEDALIVDLACSNWWARAADDATRLWSAERALARREQAGRSTGDADASEPRSIPQDAKRLAQCLPTLGVLDEAWCGERLAVFALRRRALDAIERLCSDPSAVAALIDEHAVDWVRFAYEEVRLPGRTAASEAMMCARDDGLTAEEIAARARLPLERRDRRRDEIPADIAAILTGAMSGVALGPFDEDDGVHVVWLRDRREPSPNEPGLRAAAIAELLAGELDRAGAGRRTALGPL